MTWVDSLTIFAVLTFICIWAWSKMQQQKILDTVLEIKEIIKVVGGKK